MMKRTVINEMQAWRKKLSLLGVEARIIGSTNKTWEGWRFVAVAYHPTTKRDHYLIIKEV
jgi:hypothetical protein